VGYVARLLNAYYPQTDEPAGLTDLDEKAAAVQAAIWFFSDRYVLNPGPLHNVVAGIVSDVIAAGPLEEPPPPSLTITPSSKVGPAGRLLGPFTVNTDHPPAMVTATGANMFADRKATIPIAPGTEVPTGTKIWLRPLSSSPSTAQLHATSKATVPSGNVYLYDGNWPDVTDAQRLILSQEATLTTSVVANAEFKPFGSLKVTKTIAGPAAGSQADVVIHVACTNGRKFHPFAIPAGTPAGNKSRTYHNIVAGTVCTVTEESNGSKAGTDVVVTGDGQQVTIPSDGTATVKITDTYHAIVSPGPPTTGSLVVTKTIAGPVAGSQGAVTIQAVCNGTPLSPKLMIAAGTKASNVSQSFNDIPGGSVCTVTESADGSTDKVTATVSGSGHQVTVPAGAAVPVHVTDVYEGAPGSLIVTKKFEGSGAHQHGRAAILVACGGPVDVFTFVIPAHTAGSVSRAFDGIPAGSRCTVTEVAVGRTARVTAVAIGKRQTVTIPAGGTATVHITDKFAIKAVTVTRPPAVTG
jgi:Domain of unknown function (DUF5979)/Thioester domain